jgi:hypothetical protein
MSCPLQGEPERQAVAAIGGILYQIWQSVFAWITLEGSEVLYLEGAEDFDVIGPDQATAVQVKRAAAPITLGYAKTIKAIGDFWRLRQKNPGRKIAFRYLTTSEPGFESGLPFGKDARGIEVWKIAGDAAKESSRSKLSFLAETTSTATFDASLRGRLWTKYIEI